MKLSVVIPVYNEELTIKEIIDRVLAVPLEKEIIVVDDGSTDRTPEILKSAKDRVTVVYNSLINIGKGAAIRIGFEQVKGDIIIIQDADLELDPSEYPRIIEPIMEGRADVVYGSRFLGGAGKKETNLANYLANKLLAYLTNILYGSHLTDMETAYKCFRLDVIKKMRLKSIGFEIEPELTAKTLRLGYKIYEVPISYHPRRIEEGKKIGFMDGIRAVYYLFKWKFAKIREIEK